MTDIDEIPPAPPGVSAQARRVWRATLERWQLDEHEMALLRELVRVIDRLDRLDKIVRRDGLIVDGGKAGPKAHPGLVEARQLAIAQARLSAALRLPDGEDGDESSGRRQRRVGFRGSYSMRPAS